MSRRYLDEEDDDPILSMVNIIDVFLVVIVILFVLIVQNPLNHLKADAMIVQNPGKENMEIIVKEGQKLTHYKASGKIGSGEGTKAGVTYRMADGSLVYVPDPADAKD